MEENNTANNSSCLLETKRKEEISALVRALLGENIILDEDLDAIKTDIDIHDVVERLANLQASIFERNKNIHIRNICETYGDCEKYARQYIIAGEELKEMGFELTDDESGYNEWTLASAGSAGLPEYEKLPRQPLVNGVRLDSYLIRQGVNPFKVMLDDFIIRHPNLNTEFKVARERVNELKKISFKKFTKKHKEELSKAQERLTKLTELLHKQIGYSRSAIMYDNAIKQNKGSTIKAFSDACSILDEMFKTITTNKDVVDIFNRNFVPKDQNKSNQFDALEESSYTEAFRQLSPHEREIFDAFYIDSLEYIKTSSPEEKIALLNKKSHFAHDRNFFKLVDTLFVSPMLKELYPEPNSEDEFQM